MTSTAFAYRGASVTNSTVIASPWWFKQIEGEATRALVEQIGAVDARRLGELVGHLTHEELWGVDEALVAVLGLR